MICERCNNNNTVQNVSYSSCAQANADNHLGYDDWIPQTYIPAMGWSTAGDGAICTSYGQGLAENWLNSGMNTVHNSNGGTGDGDGGDSGDDIGSDGPTSGVGINYGDPVISDCGSSFYVSSSSTGHNVTSGQTLNHSGLSTSTFSGYLCMRCQEGQSYVSVPDNGAGIFLTCDEANAVNYLGHDTWAPEHLYFTSEPCGCSGDGTPDDGGGTLDDDGNTVIIDDGGPQCYDNNPPSETTPVVDPRIITVSGTIEEIPTPRSNHITSLISPTKPNLFNKPEAYVDAAGNTQYQTLITNFITADASTHTVKAIGDLGTNYVLLLENRTSGFWYKWSAQLFNAGAMGGQGTIGDAPNINMISPDVFEIQFPAVSVDTVYKIYYSHGTGTSQTTYMPITTPTWHPEKEWTINQLANKQTNINWGTSVSGVSVVTNGTNGSTNGVFSVVSAAGSNLNNSVYNVTLTFFVAGSKTIRFNADRLNFYGSGVNNDVATVSDLETPAIGDTSVITAMSMTASFVNNGGSSGSTGTLTGTITYGQVPLHDQTFIFNPDNFFTLA